MQEREEEQEDTGNYRKANLGLEARKFSDAAKQAAAQVKREQARDAATASYQQSEAANQQARVVRSRSCRPPSGIGENHARPGPMTVHSSSLSLKSLS
jgi:hypothetical protein